MIPGMFGFLSNDLLNLWEALLGDKLAQIEERQLTVRFLLIPPYTLIWTEDQYATLLPPEGVLDMRDFPKLSDAVDYARDHHKILPESWRKGGLPTKEADKSVT